MKDERGPMTNHTLNSDPSDATEHAHRSRSEQLPAYATAIALGALPQPGYSDLAAHLEACAACRADLEELLALTIPAYAGQVEPAPAYPQPDLSFLDRRAPAPGAHGQPCWIDAAGRLVIAFSASLLETLRRPSPAGALRGQLLFRYVQEPKTLQDLQVTIEVFLEDPTRGLGRVQVSVDVPGHGPLDQAGCRVILRVDENIWQAETDETGCAVFAPFPLDALPRLRVEITPP